MPTRLPTIGHKPRPARPDDRPPPSRRGYGRLWQRVRLAKLARDPLCEDCAAAGLVVEATEVDHRDRDTGNLADENLRALCKPCHSRKTVAHDGGLGRARRG